MRMDYLSLIIDPQNDFTHVKGNYASRHGIDQITKAKSNINLLASIKHLKTIIVRAEYFPGQFIPGVSMAIANTFGHAIDKEINDQEIFNIFSKQDHSCFSSAEFTKFLRSLRPDTLMISGFLAEYCVKETATDALALGYQVILVKDAIGTGDDVQARRDDLFQEFEKKGCILMDAADCLNLFFEHD
jgi:nicotinamidase-related amidase